MESKSEGFKERMGGIGGETRDPEKSISAEYLIKFKPSDLSLLPGCKATTGTGKGGREKMCRKEEEEMQEKREPRSTVRGFCWAGVVFLQNNSSGIKMLVYHYIPFLFQR